ncbi:MAG TPA: mucoidy inhibitor MuiA family protein, partial [Candidatus Acidoferrum sp.]|nr:mucoidy inhibitor MuiA family protein [Candidatus Acidoferrum sp.]
MKTATTLAAMAVLLAGFSSTATADQAVDAPIKKVTVYSDRAMITRTAELDLNAGEHTLLFENLPEGVLDASFRASANGVRSLTILGLSHRDTVRTENPQEKVAKLEHVINDVKTQKQQAILDRLEALNEQKKFLAAVSKGAGDEMSQEVARGGIDVAQWESAFRFIGKGMVQVNDSTRLFKATLDSTQRELDMLNRTLSDYRSPVSKTTKTVQVDVRLETAGHVQVNLEYVIPGASWTPMYDARLTAGNERVDLSYNAEISQHTGEDWKEVELTLSTASPSLGAGPGNFSPWYLASFTPPQSPSGMKGQITGRIVDAQTGEPIIGASVLLAGTKLGAQTDPDGNYALNGIAPGLYTLTIASVGYNTTKVTSVDVIPQRSIAVSPQLERMSKDLGVSVEVRAKQEIIDKFCTSSQTAITADVIKQPRVSSVDQ